MKAEDLRRLAAFYGCSLSELLPPATDDQEVDGLAELFRAHPDLAEDQGPSSFAGVCATARALTDLEARLEIDATVQSPSFESLLHAALAIRRVPKRCTMEGPFSLQAPLG